MSSKQDAIRNRVEPLGSALPEGWLGRARLIAFGIVFGIIGGTTTFLIANYDRNADPIGIAGSQTSAQKSDEPTEIEPVKVEHIEGTALARVTLTEDAAKRLDIQTAIVRGTDVNGTERKVIPYAAVLYDTQGDTWTYTNPEPLTFVRQRITVDRIEKDQAVLSDGPPSASMVVTMGAQELYGSEFEFEEE